MNITNLKTNNWKGRDLDIALSPVTVITGDNFAGKTSVPMALRFALTGYLPPPIGKRNEAIFGLAGDQARPMSVSVTTDTGRKSSITLTRTAKGKVLMDGGVPADLVLPGLLVEPTTFFGMTGAERVQAVFAACDLTGIGLTASNLVDRVGKIQVMPRQYAEEAIEDIQARIIAAWVRDIPGALAKIESDLKDDLRSTKDYLTRKQAELHAVSGLSRDIPAFDEQKFKALNEEVYALKATLEQPQANEAIEVRFLAAQLEEAETAVDIAQRELSDLDELDACPKCRASARGWKKEVEAALKHDLEQARHTRDSAAKKYAEAQDVWEAKKAELQAKNLAARSKIDLLTWELEDLAAQRAALTTWKAQVARRDEAEKGVLKLQAEVEVYKQAVELVREVREDAVAKTFGKVLDVARNFTDGLLNSPIEMVDGALGRRVSEADREQGNTAPVGAWIPHEAFSGTEQLLAYAGFAVALAGQAPIKLVIMDELGRLTLHRKVALLQRMCELVQRGVIDQLVGCDVEAVEVEGVNVIVL